MFVPSYFQENEQAAMMERIATKIQVTKESGKERATPKCKSCHMPMKGHPRGQCAPE